MKLGAQCQEKGAGVYQYNREIQPNSIKAINVTDTDFWQRIWNENPRLKYAIYRECPNGQMPWDGNPPDIASGWVDLMERKVGHLIQTGLLTHFEGYNEWVFSDQPYWFDAADRFMSVLIEKTHARFGGKIHVIVGNFACGHFSEDIVNFPKTLAALNACGKCLLGTHEYDRDDLNRTAGNWLCGKWKRQDAAIKAAGYTNVGIALTEAGLDHLVQNPPGPQVGWRHYGATIEAAVTHLLNANNLGWYVPLIEADAVVKLVSWFGCSMYWSNDWGEKGFDLANRDGSFPTGLLEGIKNLEGEEPPPPEPNGGEPMDVKVYDFDGVQKDWAWLVSTFGPKLKILPVEQRFPPKVGDRIYKVDVIRAKRGYSSCLIQVKNLEGAPVQGKTVVWGWGDAPAHELENKGWNWTAKGIPGATNETGDVGPGMGTGAYYHPDNPDDDMGPHWCWIHTLASDYVEGIGMLSMTFHDHPDIGYREVIYQGESPTPPTTDGELLKEIQGFRDEARSRLDRIIELMGAVPPIPPPPEPEPELFHGEFYNGIALVGPIIWSHDVEKIDFFWGEGSPNPAVPKDYFSARWTGSITFEAGKYVFHTYTDDGVKLLVDGVPVINQWVDQSPRQWDSAPIVLTAGKHAIEMQFYEKAGGATVKMWWEKQSILSRIFSRFVKKR